MRWWVIAGACWPEALRNALPPNMEITPHIYCCVLHAPRCYDILRALPDWGGFEYRRCCFDERPLTVNGVDKAV